MLKQKSICFIAAMVVPDRLPPDDFGRGRELEKNLVEFEAKALRNGIDENYESGTFLNNDYLSALFRFPMSGYVSMEEVWKNIVISQ